MAAASVKARDDVRSWASARVRLVVALSAGLVAGLGAAHFAAWPVSVLIGWVVGAIAFLVQVWPVILHADAARTCAIATAEDDSRVASELSLLCASVASLVGVAFELVKASSAEGQAVVWLTMLAVGAVVSAWACVHTIFTLRYARLYWMTHTGVDFNQHDDPDYHDFAYLAFTIGMTFQVSDTDLQSKQIRRTALRHALVSFLFGTAIIAVTINVVANLLH